MKWMKLDPSILLVPIRFSASSHFLILECGVEEAIWSVTEGACGFATLFFEQHLLRLFVKT